MRDRLERRGARKAMWTNYEHHREALLPGRVFMRRVGNHVLAALVLLVASLALGILGYRTTEGMSWIDATYHASMILGGMGPTSEVTSTAGKLFGSFYALFSGIVFLVMAGIVLAPLIHRLLHRLHVED